MRIIHSDKHALRDARTELHGGLLAPPFESPARIAPILARIRETGVGAVEAPVAHGLGPVRRVHDARYLEFLATAWERWCAEGFEGEAIPTVWPSRRMAHDRPPASIDGALGYWCLAGETAITQGTWEAAQSSADVAVTAADIVGGGARAAFALCRPPGHHAAQDMYGGYCFLNNAAIAARRLRDAGAARVALLDVDFHHGNGTQAIFYDCADVLFVSLHGDPETEFPYFLGRADETGVGAGEGFTCNHPLPAGSDYAVWSEALEAACARITGYAPDALVVSLGVDAFAGDPLGAFRLQSEDFTRCGARLGRLGLPTLFVMEGGYAVAEIGLNTVNALQGFEDG